MPVGALIGAGTSLLGGLLGRQKAQPYSQTSTTSPNYTDEEGRINNLVFRKIKKGLKRGGDIPQWMRTQAYENINTGYDAALKRLELDAARRGFSDSGATGRERMGLEVGRAGGLRQTEIDLTRDAMERIKDYIMMGMQFGAPDSQTTTTTGTGMPGQSVGQALAGPVAGIGQDLATYFMMKKFMGGGGAGAGGFSVPSMGGISGAINPFR